MLAKGLLREVHSTAGQPVRLATVRPPRARPYEPTTEMLIKEWRPRKVARRLEVLTEVPEDQRSSRETPYMPSPARLSKERA